jgi:hypothetical protein
MKTTTIILCALLLSFNSENPDTRQLTPSELKEDVSVLRKALEKYHPGLYWYTSQHQFNLAWNDLDNHLQKPMSDLEFFAQLLPVVANVKCAHTFFLPSEEIFTRGTRFPLDLRFVNGKAYIMSDSLNQYQIPNGSELLAVNGKSLQQIVNLLLPELMAQGGNLGWKYVLLENDFQNYYYYSIDQSKSFEIEYTDYGTKEKVLRIVAGSREEARRRHWKNWYPKETGLPLTLKYFTNPDVALITVKSFSKGRHKQYHQDFDKLIAQYFAELETRHIQHLIIDVRGNEGGNNPEKLYSYIARINDKGTDGKAIKPADHRFEGDVIVLANERSISAQESFVAIFKNNNRGLTMGQPTPGSYEGLCGGNKRRIALPNSHFEIRIPLHASLRTYIVAMKDQKGEGLSPDIKVDVNINDVLSGKDSTLLLALDRIRNGLRE